MIPELGTFAIIIAFCFALIQSIAINIRTRAAVGQFIFLNLAMLCLIASFLNNDLSVIYVREHSHQLLPFIYRIGAAWGGHEGSLLLWCLILSGWTVAFIIFNRSSAKIFQKMIQILGIISAGFIAFLLFTSNPFARDFPTEILTGDDLTPVLQDPGLIFHPPMLYLGYVGFAIGFAFAIAALLEGKLHQEWAKALRPWIILPWSFLSCGIVLGSWWAYRELGWGGWWFWDPVENASLLPWLVATALIHSLIVSEKRNVFKGWTILLAIITFTLSLLGTFLVRSGVLVSVHAFASDPTRGIFLLIYLTILIGGALLLYGFRIKHFYQAPRFQFFSRETFLLMNSVILLVVAVTIVIGTLYPILLDALHLEKISVGEPYFNTVFVPIMLPFLFLMGLAPHVNWQQESMEYIREKLSSVALFSLFISLIFPWIFRFEFHWSTVIGMFFAVWILVSTWRYIWDITLHNKLRLNHLAMIIAHVGIAVLALGITLNKSYSEERQIKIFPGETTSLATYQFTFNNVEKKAGPNYQSLIATFLVKNQHGKKYLLSAEQRIYSHDQMLNKTGILFNAWRDIYLALGTSLSDGSWSVRIYYKPFVRWIWIGGFMLLLGGMISLVGSRVRRDQA